MRTHSGHVMALFIASWAVPPRIESQVRNFVVECVLPQRANPNITPSADCRAFNAYKRQAESIFLEQDFLQRIGATTDRNYTMGFGFGRSGPQVTLQNHDFALRLAERGTDWLVDHIVHPILPSVVGLDPIKRLNLEGLNSLRSYSEMLSGTAFTPQNLRATEPVIGDRPYGFLLGWTVSRITPEVTLDPNHALTSDFTFGTIGSRLGRNVQRFIHHTSRTSSGDSTPFDPKGWANQIMDVPSIWLGVPAVRYGLGRSDRGWHILDPWRKQATVFDIVSDVEGEIGYYTDADVGLRARFGLTSIPFWAWKQDPLTVGSRGLGGSGPVCLNLGIVCLDGFAFAGGKARAIGYNALLQGYTGYRGYQIPWQDRKYFGTEVSLGAAATMWFGSSRTNGIQISDELYAHRSAEYSGALQSSHSWGGIYITYIH